MKRILLTLFMGLFLISLTSAVSIGTFKVGDSINLIQTCASCTYNNVTTVIHPNGTIETLNVEMSKDGSFFNYTYNGFSLVVGEYLVNGLGDISGVNTSWNYRFEITPSGSLIDNDNSLMLFLAIGFFIILGILCFFGFYKSTGNIGIAMPVKWTFFIFGFIFFLTSINLISATIGDSLVNNDILGFFDTFAAVSFYLFWFAFGILGVLWFLTTLQTLLFKTNQRKMEKMRGYE